MDKLDWAILVLYFLVIIGIGTWAKRRVKNPEDFFAAGGKMPFWLAGISHHMSGYSAAVFVAYAAIAYNTGFALYIWWAITNTIGCIVCAFLFAPRWARLRIRYNIVSPLEFLKTRYNVSTQQLLAWAGACLKIFDTAAKWAAAAILLKVFADVPFDLGVAITGGVTMIYATIGGLWADALTDFGQFIIQFVGGVAMFVVVLLEFGGFSSIWHIWSRLPASHSHAFSGQFSLWFFLAYCLISTLSNSGGTWNLAQRFIASPSGAAAQKASFISAGLYLVWPLILFFPMWAAPLIFPHLANPSHSYGLLATHLLPHGLIGLVLAGLFSHTMAMSSSDSNAISAVITRDILPVLTGKKDMKSTSLELRVGRLATFLFIGLSVVIALEASSFGGVLGLIIDWFGALVGPIAIPMLFGMLKPFRRSGPDAAIISWTAGLITFAVVKYVVPGWVATFGNADQAIEVGSPVIVALIVYLVIGLIHPWHDDQSNSLIDNL